MQLMRHSLRRRESGVWVVQSEAKDIDSCKVYLENFRVPSISSLPDLGFLDTTSDSVLLLRSITTALHEKLLF